MVKRIHGAGERIFLFLCYAIVTGTAVTMLYPIVNVAAVSMTSYRSYMQNPWMIYPMEPDFTAYKMVLGSSLLIKSYVNTIIITVTGTLLTLVTTILMAYPLSRPQFRGKGFFMSIIIFTMMFGGGTIPGFLVIKALGLYDTLRAQIYPGVLSAFHVILMINFFKSLPESLTDAAKIDGAAEPDILVWIAVPLSKPIIATIALFAAVGYWNNYFSGVVYARSRSKWPVQLVLREIITRAQTAMLNSEGNAAEINILDIPSAALQYASLVVVMLPVMCIYPFLQKHFARGVLLGAVKG